MKLKGMAGSFTRAGVMALGAVVLSLAAVSCSTGEDSPQPERPLAFGIRTGAVKARGIVATEVKKIGVFGYSHAGAWSASGATATPDYFLNHSVIDPLGDGSWTYDGYIRYWPMTGRNLSFFAYAPYVDVEDTFTLYPRAATDSGTPTITYTVPRAIQNQVDLLYNSRLDQTYTTNGGTVAFRMDHALVRVGVQLKLDEEEAERPFVVSITEMTVGNVIGSGTLDLSKGIASSPWTLDRPANGTGLAAYTATRTNGMLGLNDFDTRVTDPAEGEFNPFSFNDLMVGGHYLMLLPQPLSAQSDGLPQQTLTLKGTITNTTLGTVTPFERSFPLYQALLPEWKAGMGVTYQLKFTIEGGIAVKFEIEGFDVNGTPWEDQNGNDPITGTV